MAGHRLRTVVVKVSHAPEPNIATVGHTFKTYVASRTVLTFIPFRLTIVRSICLPNFTVFQPLFFP